MSAVSGGMVTAPETADIPDGSPADGAAGAPRARSREEITANRAAAGAARAPQPRHTGTFFIWNEHMIHQGFRGARISKISYEAAPLTTGRSRITALTRHPGSSNRAVRAGPPPATAASSPPPAGAPPAWHVSDPGHIGTHYILERSLSVPNCSRSCIRPGPAASAATAGAEVQVVAHKRVEGEGSLDLVPFWKPPKSTERMMRITISSRTHSRQPPARDRGQRRRRSR